MARNKVRIRFQKGEDLRLISHHDLMRCFERMLRRAAVPVHSSQGFNPKPRLVFALSLGLGIVGCQEVAELELDEEMEPEELRRRLRQQAPPGLEILSVRQLHSTKGAQARRASYRIPLPPNRALDVADRIPDVLASTHCWVDRTRPQARRIDLRPYVCDLRVISNSLEMEFWVTPQGTARPLEILQILGLADLLDQGFVLERTALEIVDELSVIQPEGSS